MKLNSKQRNRLIKLFDEYENAVYHARWSYRDLGQNHPGRIDADVIFDFEWNLREATSAYNLAARIAEKIKNEFGIILEDIE